MAATRISDVIVPEVFAPYVLEPSTKTNKLLSSGAVVLDAQISGNLAGGGLTFNYSSWDSTADSSGDTDVSNDDPASVATPEKIGSKQQIVARLERNKSWSTTDIAGQLAGSDPMQAIASSVGDYFDTQRNKTLVSLLTGFTGSAGMASHVNAIYSDLASPAATAGIGAGAIIETKSAWGDHTSNGDVIVMHSDSYNSLLLQNLISFQATNVQDIGWGTYLGFVVAVDDALPKVAGVNASAYATYIVKSGGIMFGTALRPDAVETDREPLQGNGGGVEILVVRDCLAFQVKGAKWTGTPASITPTNAELATVGNWAVAAELKNIPIVTLKHNVLNADGTAK